MKYVCMCCGWDQVDFKPYENYPESPVSTKNLNPPYSNVWGEASYEVCDCCGFEFGNDDDPGKGAKADSFESFRKEWLKDGAQWLKGGRRPKDWDLKMQLARLQD